MEQGIEKTDTTVNLLLPTTDITVKSSLKSLLPRPSNTKDRLRWIMIFGIFGAGVVVTLFALAYSLVIWLSDWGVGLLPTQLNYLGSALIISWFTIIIVVVTFGLGGPVGRVKGSIGKINIEAEGDANIENPNG